MTKEEIALTENVSSAKVTWTSQAALVPGEMVSVLPAINDISLSDYQFSLKLSEEINHKRTSVRELTDKVWQGLMALSNYPVIDKSKVLSVFQAESKVLVEPPAKTAETRKLKEFVGRNQFARKKADSERRLVVYEFSRISNEMQSGVSEAIKRTLGKPPLSGGQKLGKKDAK